MRFKRFKNHDRKGVTPRRLAAAKKAVQRDKDSWALFPEYVKHDTAEERIQAIDEGLEEGDVEHRADRAKAWREVRAYLNTLAEPLRTRVLHNWNRRQWMPAEPYALRELVRSALNGTFDPEKQEREIERCKMLGMYQREILATAQIPEGLSPLDRCLYLLGEARKKIMETHPHLLAKD